MFWCQDVKNDKKHCFSNVFFSKMFIVSEPPTCQPTHILGLVFFLSCRTTSLLLYLHCGCFLQCMHLVLCPSTTPLFNSLVAILSGEQAEVTPGYIPERCFFDNSFNCWLNIEKANVLSCLVWPLTFSIFRSLFSPTMRPSYWGQSM